MEAIPTGMETETQVRNETTSRALKDHCDFLMDSIDAQLSQMQGSISASHGQPAAGSLTERLTFRNTTELSGRTVAGCPGQVEIRSLIGPRDATVTCGQSAGPRSDPDLPLARPGGQVVDGDSRRGQYEWRVQCLLGPQQMQDEAHHSDSNSICTEDFASRFHEGMVDPALNFDSRSDGSLSVCSQASLGEPSQESTNHHPEPQGNLGSEAWDLPREESGMERAGRDRVCRQGRGIALSEISGGIQESRSTGKGELVGCMEDEATIDKSARSAVQGGEVGQQVEEELEQVLPGTRSGAGCGWEQAAPWDRTRRTPSVESLGDRISKLSHNNMLEQTSAQKNLPAENGTGLPISDTDPPVNSNPQRGSVSVVGRPLATSPGLESHEDLSTDLNGIGIKLTETLKRLSRNRERRGRNVSSELRPPSAVSISEQIPFQDGSVAPKFHLHSPGDIQLDKELVNRCHPQYRVSPMSVFCHIENASPAPTEGTAKAPISGQQKRTSSGPGGCESRPQPSEPSRDCPVQPPDSAPLPACPVRGGSGVSEASANPCPVTGHAALAPRSRVGSLDPPRDKLTSCGRVSKAKWVHWRSVTQGAYSEVLPSLRDKPPLGGGLQAIADASGTCSVRTRCGSMKETSRHASSQKATVSETLRPPFAERSREQRNSKWGRSWRECPNRSCMWNRSPPMSSTSRDHSVKEEKLIMKKHQLQVSRQSRSDALQQEKQVTGDRQSPQKTAERGQQEARSLGAPTKETQSEINQARMEMVILDYNGDGSQQELPDPRSGSVLHNTPNQNKVTGGVQNQQPERSAVRQEQREAQLTQLLERNSNLELRVRELDRSLETAVNPSSCHWDRFHKLLAQLTERDLKVSALGKILSEKELERWRLREAVVTLQVQKEAQLSSREILRREHERQLAISAVEGQQRQAQREESLSLREQLCPPEEAMKKLSEELKQEAKTMVQNALAQEYKKWDMDREEQLQQQRLSLRKENERAITQAKEELEKERRNSLASQNKIIELQKRMQELELRNRSLQQEKEGAVRDVRSVLAEEKRKELQQLREEMGLEKEREVKRLSWKMAQVEGELANLQSRSREAALREREAREQRERSFVSEIRKECECLQALIWSTRGRALGEIGSLPSTKLRSPSQMTPGEALHTLRRVGEDIQQLVMDLHQQLETQLQEREVKQQQGEQFSLEKGKALAALEDRLIQNHSEHSRLQSSPMQDSGSEEDHTRQQQLLEKGTELRTVQRNMAKWKDETVCKLAHKLEEEVNEKDEKCLSGSRSMAEQPSPGLSQCQPVRQYWGLLKKTEHQQTIEKLETEIHQLSLEHSESSHLRSTPTPSLASSPVVALRQQNFGTLKLLQHLQSRVKQLRAENLIYQGTGLKDINTAR